MVLEGRPTLSSGIRVFVVVRGLWWFRHTSVAFAYRNRPVSSRFETENEYVDYILPIMTFPYDFKKNQ